jgi:hypothetical protein
LRVGWRVGREADSRFFGGFGIQGEDFEEEPFIDLIPFLVAL